jgi:hypothetical protein
MEIPPWIDPWNPVLLYDKGMIEMTKGQGHVELDAEIRP